MMDAPQLINGRIVRSEDPPNLEMPFENLDGFITPTPSFYVRTHFPIPKLDKTEWRLRIEGEVNQTIDLDFSQLLELPSRTMPVTLECAGNNRDLLTTKVKGVQWGLGAVGTAEWTGAPLGAVLERAGIKSSASEVILEGADQGELEDPKAPRGNVRFARSVPISKAKSDVLLVYKMNGADLPPEHGFPVRAIVPGWFAVASIKWLQRIIVTDRPFNGYYQTLDYGFWKREGDNAVLAPLQEMQVKAEIARPTAGEILAANSSVRVHGAAWSGEAEIAKVEISADGGKTWNEGELGDKSVPSAWRLWEYNWQTPATPGQHTLIARATDSAGRSQPLDRDPDRGTYMINHLLPITVEVR